MKLQIVDLQHAIYELRKEGYNIKDSWIKKVNKYGKKIQYKEVFIGGIKMKEFYEKLIKIQSELKAPKNQRNGYGNYNYRSCEDIFEAVKPLLNKKQFSINSK